jgi:hypothetical protein
MLARGETLYDLSNTVAAWKLQHRHHPTRQGAR